MCVLVVALMILLATALHLRRLGKQMLADADKKKDRQRQWERGTPCEPVSLYNDAYETTQCGWYAMVSGRTMIVGKFTFCALFSRLNVCGSRSCRRGSGMLELRHRRGNGQRRSKATKQEQLDCLVAVPASMVRHHGYEKSIH